MATLPNFFIVGAPKAGTTSLYEYLKNIPGIYMPKIKEPNYFSISTVVENDPRLNPIREKSKYLKLFKNVKNEKIIGEASTSYLADPMAPKLIHQMIPNARIVISLRDPLERLFSHYLMNILDNQLKLSFHDELQKELKCSRGFEYESPGIRLKASFYYEDVKRYLDFFGSKQVKIIIFEEFIKNPKGTINEILGFCGLNYTQDELKDVHNPFVQPRGQVSKFILTNRTIVKLAKKIIPKSNRKILRKKVFTKKVAKPEMEKNDKEVLVNLFQNDVKKLKTLIGHDFHWPNF